MSKTEFDEFVRGQQVPHAEAASFDPKRQLEEWRQYLDQLYRQIEGYMASYAAEGTAKIDFKDIELNEEFSGTYTVREMLLEIGRSVVTFRPIGTMLIGSKGRVDVRGPHGSARLGLVNKKVTRARELVRVTVSMIGQSRPPPPKRDDEKVEWAWKVITAPPDVRFIELTQDSFFGMILSVADA